MANFSETRGEVHPLLLLPAVLFRKGWPEYGLRKTALCDVTEGKGTSATDSTASSMSPCKHRKGPIKCLNKRLTGYFFFFFFQEAENRGLKIWDLETLFCASILDFNSLIQTVRIKTQNPNQTLQTNIPFRVLWFLFANEFLRHDGTVNLSRLILHRNLGQSSR